MARSLNKIWRFFITFFPLFDPFDRLMHLSNSRLPLRHEKSTKNASERATVILLKILQLLTLNLMSLNLFHWLWLNIHFDFVTLTVAITEG